ncbi:MAG: trigger factor [Oscillatoriales cyanobacterium]|nr:MAG: trigger factor [Oscillatoriales cyanobacterium]
MKVTQEKLSASQVSLTIEVPADLSAKVYEDTITKYAKSATFPGFRKGKVPRAMVIQRIGSAALKAASLDELVEAGVKAAIKQEKIEPAGQAQITSSEEELFTQFEPGQTLTFQVKLDVVPDIELPTYTGLTIQAERVDPDPERVDRILEQQQESSADLIPVEGRPAQLGDAVVIDYKGTLTSEEGKTEPEDLSGLEATDFQVELDQKKFIPGFVDGIVGMNAGESKSIVVQFPADYGREDLQDREVTFEITLHDIKERELPELTDEFIKSISKYENLAELRAEFESQYQKEADEQTEQNKEAALIAALIDSTEVEVPEGLIQQEVRAIVNQSMYQLQNQGIDVRKFMNDELMANMQETARPDAIRQVKTDLILRAVGRQESIEVTDAEVQARAKELKAALSGQKVDRARLESVVYEELYRGKVMTWLAENNSFELLEPGSLTPPAEEVPAAEATVDVAVEAGDETADETAADDQASEAAKVSSKKAKPKKGN